MDSFAKTYDPLDPNGNITIRWDVMCWSPNGYIVIVIWTLTLVDSSIHLFFYFSFSLNFLMYFII